MAEKEIITKRESEKTPLMAPIKNDESHVDVHEFVGHGNRLSYNEKHTSLIRTSVNASENSEITEWRDQDEGDSNFSAFINLVTGAIGSGVVYLPGAAGGCGLVLALILIVVMGLVSAHTTSLVGLLLIMARNGAKRLKMEREIETFEDMARVIWGKIGFGFVAFINYLDLYLTVAVFMGTLAATVSNAVWAIEQGDDITTNPDAPEWRYYVFLAGFVVIVLPLCCLKSMDAISKMSIVGVLANVVILICIIVSACLPKDNFNKNLALFNAKANDSSILNKNDDYMTMFPGGKLDHKYADFSQMWGAYGNFGFSYAVAVCAPSLIVGMKAPKNLGKVVWSSHAVICFIYSAVIIVSWFAWGNGIVDWEVADGKWDAQGNSLDSDAKNAAFTQRLELNGARNIINNLTMPTLAIQTIAALMLTISIVSSVPLFFFSIAVFVEEKFREKFPNVNEFMFRLANRTILLVFCVAPALIGENLLCSFQGLTGALTTTAMCAILPNIMFFFMIKMFPKDHYFQTSKSKIFYVICALALFVGTCTLIIGFIFDGLQGMFGMNITD